MAAAAASFPPWIPEDDLLLKNAIEAGASLEALAKGAVQFSRKFTVRELRDRWYSLLYDPIISAEASARMTEFELSVPNSKVCSEVSVKRKLESVRRLYYTMRKKTCNRPGSLSLPSEPDIGNVPFDNQSHSGLGGQEMALSHPRPQNPEKFPSLLPIYETNEDNSEPAMPIAKHNGQEEASIPHDDADLAGNNESLSEMSAVHSGAILQYKNAINILNSSTAISDSDYAELSESLLNFVNDDQLLEGEYPIDKPYDGILLSCPDDIYDQELVVKDSQTLVSDKSLVVAAETLAEGSPCGDGHFCSDINIPSSTLAANMEPFDGEMECTLNSEDLEIPCNDDVFLPKQFTYSIIPFSASTSLKDEKQEKRWVRKEENPAQSIISSQIKGSVTIRQTRQGLQLVGCGLKSNSPNDMASTLASNAHKDPNESIGAPITGAMDSCNNLDFSLYASSCALQQDASVSEADPTTLDQQESESDDDIPSYSEIEAMILGLDLCPDNTDSYINREVSTYQNEDIRRTIIRLEQCAQSSIHRSIASRGALAVLYGRHLKHYIRVPEVILGRATEDMEIDIDLGREGPANKISRRQALVKMEADGSFVLTNLGKNLVFLNGKEVANGQSRSLCSGCLIEIGEMAFVFEINNKSVRQHLVNAKKSHHQSSMKFE